MSLATPRPRNLNASVYSPSGAPPSPPPVFSLTSAFFQSPFSVARPATHNTTPQPSASLPALSAGFELQQLLADVGAAEHDATPRRCELDWRASAQWTPLSARSSSLIGRQQTPAHREDRLDRLLADIDAQPSPPPPLLASPKPALAECWELPSLETRFEPVHTAAPARPLRPCLKTRSVSLSSADSGSLLSASLLSESRSSEGASDSDSLSAADSLGPDTPSDMRSPALLHDDDRTVRVRFDDDSVEEFLTWSRESYDRKGPLPITKLNVREVIELKLIKEELGISPLAPAISPASSVCPPPAALLPPADH